MEMSEDIAICLLRQPWVSVHLGNSPFMVKVSLGDASYGFMISDLQSVWYEEVNSDVIKCRSQELNKRLRAPVSSFFRHLAELMHPLLDGGVQGSTAAFSWEKVDNRLLVHVKSELSGVPFHWHFNCCQATIPMVTHHLVRPLLRMSLALWRQQEELATLLEKKDKEILEYKENGASLSRGHLETAVFEKQKFEDMLLLEVAEVCSGPEEEIFPHELHKLYVRMMHQEMQQKRKHSETEEGQDEILKDAKPSPETMEGKQEVEVTSLITSEETTLPAPLARNHLQSQRPVLKPKKKKAKGLFS
ncbi:non-homologous end-joining factor 1 isoform X3 [Latimeria chalumnae]|uniref:non-homologous end-joining factor 1 isoform X3 n=1 Tax=Latimeria chalumnae TaxID=7897 RepID=UPI0003C1034A|nr:PREDICTED: non-homologous end-joining factor 1 isoform X2 [Latimeria chalumnae]|eukprot:XP_005995838.1 PREDICTED: non-homologous end-joining factor 1 isoform X2 [Latimeria chalumnae]